MADDQIGQLTEELFCTRFELETMASSMFKGSLERWVPGFSSDSTEEQHVKRYDWSCQFVTGKHVLDMACGVGRGTYMLAEKGKAASVVGVDIDAEAIRYASFRNAHANALYSVGDAQAFTSDRKFDVVIGFETIEHLPKVADYLQTVKSVLAPDGMFLVSTPISKKPVDHSPSNRFHVIEWGMEAFAEELGKFFRIEKTFVQLRKPPQNVLMKLTRSSSGGFEPLIPVDASTLVPHTGLGVKYKGYQIAVCRQL